MKNRTTTHRATSGALSPRIRIAETSADPRRPQSRRHPLSAMLTLIALGLLMGGRDMLGIWRRVAKLDERQRAGRRGIAREGRRRSCGGRRRYCRGRCPSVRRGRRFWVAAAGSRARGAGRARWMDRTAARWPGVPAGRMARVFPVLQRRQELAGKARAMRKVECARGSRRARCDWVSSACEDQWQDYQGGGKKKVTGR